MSTQTNHYVIYGYSLAWENTDWLAEKHGDSENKLFSTFEEYRDSAFKVSLNGNFLILDDGRNGKHLLMGICIAATEEGGDFNLVTCKVSPKQKKLLKSKLKELKVKLPAYYGFEKRIENLKPNFYVVTHLR